MATIVEYTDKKAPENAFPERIVSPTHASPCCFRDMEPIGEIQKDHQWLFRYQRCRHCGFTVRVILRYMPDAALLRYLRRVLANSRAMRLES